jgi:hypothetical protein
MAGPGPESPPPPGNEFAEFVRRALHAAADQVEPRGDALDGLEPIRARILFWWGVPWPEVLSAGSVRGRTGVGTQRVVG